MAGREVLVSLEAESASEWDHLHISGRWLTHDKNILDLANRAQIRFFFSSAKKSILWPEVEGLIPGQGIPRTKNGTSCSFAWS